MAKDDEEEVESRSEGSEAFGEGEMELSEVKQGVGDVGVVL